MTRKRHPAEDNPSCTPNSPSESERSNDCETCESSVGHMDKEEMTDALGELSVRRIQAFSGGNGKSLSTREHLALIPESTTPDDIYLLATARNMLDEFSKNVLDLYVDVWREFGKHRCSVCGRTSQQSRAIGYDCAREC